MFSEHLCTLSRLILYDNKTRALSVSVGENFCPPTSYKFLPEGLWYYTAVTAHYIYFILLYINL